jgi:hypothetical protein
MKGKNFLENLYPNLMPGSSKFFKGENQAMVKKIYIKG